MIKTLHKVPYARFRKNEFRNLITEIIAVVLLFDPAAMFIKIMFDRLIAANELLKSLKVKAGSHPQTKELADVRKRSKGLIETIVAQVKNIVKANLDAQVASAGLVEPFVKRYLKPIVNADWMKKTDVLKEMFEALEADSALQNAIADLSLTAFFNELKSLLDSQYTIKEMRSAAIREKRKINTSELKALATTALLELFAAIELSQIEHPEKDYTKLINGINEKLSYYSAQVRTRGTIGKKSADGTVVTADASAA